jgi:anti-anti-sigma factor
MAVRVRAGNEVRDTTPALGFHVQTNWLDGRVAEIIVAGELDMGTSPILREVIDVCCARAEIAKLIVDLHELSFIDSTGLRVLWSSHDKMLSVGGELCLRAPSAAVTRLLEVTRLDKILAVLDDAD